MTKQLSLIEPTDEEVEAYRQKELDKLKEKLDNQQKLLAILSRKFNTKENPR